MLLDLAVPADVFRAANLFAPGAFEAHFCGLTGELETGLPGLFLSHLEPLPARLALAGDLIRETRWGMEQIAERAGFGSAHHLRRVWRRYAPGTPGALRAQSQA